MVSMTLHTSCNSIIRVNLDLLFYSHYIWIHTARTTQEHYNYHTLISQNNLGQGSVLLNFYLLRYKSSLQILSRVNIEMDCRIFQIHFLTANEY